MKIVLCLMCFTLLAVGCASELVEPQWRAPPGCATRSGKDLARCEGEIEERLCNDSPARKYGPLEPNSAYRAQLFQYRNEVYELQTGHPAEFDGGVSVEVIEQTLQPAPLPSTATSDQR